MIIPIIINFDSIKSAFSSIGADEINDIADNIAKTLAAKYYGQLVNLAAQELHQTRKRYIDAVTLRDTGRFEATVTLDYFKDPLIQMLEEGASAFDMKTAMLNSPKAKTSKSGGKYITVPFRIGTPGAVADSDVFSGVMPSTVYEAAKALATIAGGDSDQLSTSDLPAQYQSPAKRAEIKDSAGKALFMEYQHKTSIYTGVFKRNDATTNQNSYRSFRRISNNSDPNSWIHKGMEAYNLVSRALSGFDEATETQVALNMEFQRLGLM